MDSMGRLPCFSRNRSLHNSVTTANVRPEKTSRIAPKIAGTHACCAERFLRRILTPGGYTQPNAKRILFARRHMFRSRPVISEERCSPEPVECGNSLCESGETVGGCPQDCKPGGPPFDQSAHKSMIWDSITRYYLVHVPTCYAPPKEVPLVVALHGGAGTGEAVEKQLRLNSKADEECFIAVYPNGVSYVGTPGTRQVWNSGPREQYPEIDDVGFISSMIAELKRDYRIDERMVYATGISSGGRMTYRLACELSDTIAAVAPIGAPLHAECNPARSISVLHFHGTDDMHNPYDGGPSCSSAGDLNVPSVSDTIGFWTNENGCPDQSEVTYENGEVTCETYAPCDSGSEVTLCTIDNGGHTVPGGYAYPIEKLIGIGKVTRDINAVDAMWDFFAAHPLPDGVDCQIGTMDCNDIQDGCETGTSDGSCPKEVTDGCGCRMNSQSNFWGLVVLLLVCLCLRRRRLPR